MANGGVGAAPRILISNDDGIDAHGLKVMEEIAGNISDDVWVVAPQTEQSGAAHSLTLTQPLRMHEVGQKRYSVQGTPTDCVMLAVSHLLDGQRPDLLLSGINMGVNLAEDVTYSGTVAAAIEGALLGIPSIAISQQINWETREAHWDSASAFAPDLIAKLLGSEWPPGVLMNINIPNLAANDIQEIQATVQGQRNASQMIVDQRTDMRGDPYYWIGFRENVGNPHSETDLAAIERGAISVTPLAIDLTDRAMRDRVAEILSGNEDPA
jgi:5'-nucleotidase